MAAGSVLKSGFFPVKDDLSPVKMPSSYQSDISEFELLDLYAMDLRVDNPEAWLSGPMEKRKVNRGMRKSTSLGALNRSSQTEVPCDEDYFTETSEHLLPAGSPPSQSTPNNPSKTVRRIDHRAAGDGPVSPVPHIDLNSDSEEAEDHNKTVIRAANRTFGKEDQLPLCSAQHNPVQTKLSAEDVVDPKAMSQTVSKAAGSDVRSKPSVIAKPGLRPPSKPPVTSRPVGNGGMNRTTSLGNLSSNRLSVASTPVNNSSAVSTRASSGSLTGGFQGSNGNIASNVRTNGTTQRSVKPTSTGPLNTVQPKIGGSASVSTAPRRPVTGMAKLPSGIPAPSGAAGSSVASSRIPRPVRK